MSEIEKIQKRHDKFEALRLKEGDYMNDEDGFAAVDDREWLLGEVARLHESIRTMRARCVELDDSDAVSAVMDIASSVLDGEP